VSEMLDAAGTADRAGAVADDRPGMHAGDPVAQSLGLV
jgi:hypothetical protein